MGALPLFEAVPDDGDFTDFVLPPLPSIGAAVGDNDFPNGHFFPEKWTPSHRSGSAQRGGQPPAPCATSSSPPPVSTGPILSGFVCSAVTQGEGGEQIDRNASRSNAVGEESTLSPALRSIAELRQLHQAKGHTPATDQQRGPAFFTGMAHDFIGAAFRTRDAAKRRNRLVAAAAMIVALIDKEDFAAAASSSAAVGDQ